MPSIIKPMRSLLLVLTLLALDLQLVAACTCAADLPLIEYIAFADAVFTGKVVDATPAFLSPLPTP